jgi:hypothetical protein
VIPYRLAIEDIEPQRFVAWALDLPGCFGRGPTAAEALDAAPGAIADYFAWAAAHDPATPRPSAAVETRLVESFTARPSAQRPGYLINAFFEDDRRALAFWDVAVALRVLEWSREDLLRLLASLPGDLLRRVAPRQGPRSIADVVEHAAGAENWYFSHLGLAIDRAGLPADPIARLHAVRVHARSVLPDLVGDDRVIERYGEFWSARKIVRRMLWHERVHAAQIARVGEALREA